MEVAKVPSPTIRVMERVPSLNLTVERVPNQTTLLVDILAPKV